MVAKLGGVEEWKVKKEDTGRYLDHAIAVFGFTRVRAVSFYGVYCMCLLYSDSHGYGMCPFMVFILEVFN